jgi:taurine transport system permease protein
LPASAPDIFTGLRTAIGVAYTTLVSAEMVAATSGIGWMVIDASKYLKSDVMFVGIIIMGLTGLLIDFILKRIESKLVFWKGK